MPQSLRQEAPWGSCFFVYSTETEKMSHQIQLIPLKGYFVFVHKSAGQTIVDKPTYLFLTSPLI